MADALRRTRSRVTRSGGSMPFVRNFSWHDNMALPVQVIELPEDLFPDGFPVIKRHWIIIGKKDNGQDRYGPPIMCTEGFESTGGHCVTCYGKATNQITADRGAASAGEEVVVPIYDHAKYRKNADSNRFEPVHPNVQVIPDQQQNILVGSYKAMFLSESQFSKMLDEHDNVQNICTDCGGQMLLESMSCGECQAPVYEAEQIAAMNEDQFADASFEEIECELCKHTGLLEIKRRCSQCGGEQPKRVYDIVLGALRKKVARKSGNGTRTDYSFTRLDQVQTLQFDPEELSEFLNRVHMIVTNGPSLAQQAEQLKIQIPEEWLSNASTQATRPYGAS